MKFEFRKFKPGEKEQLTGNQTTRDMVLLSVVLSGVLAIMIILYNLFTHQAIEYPRVLLTVIVFFVINLSWSIFDKHRLKD